MTDSDNDDVVVHPEYHGLPSEDSPFYRLHMHLVEVLNDTNTYVCKQVIDEALQNAVIVGGWLNSPMSLPEFR